MAKTNLDVVLIRDGIPRGTIRTFGGNTTDVRSEYYVYEKMDIQELVKCFPRVLFEKGDVINISCRWGTVDRIV
jgi:hypothetical protein